MLQGGMIVLASLVYVGFLFVCAVYSGKRADRSGRDNLFLQVFSFGVCFSGSFFFVLFEAAHSRSGLLPLDIFALLLGPVIFFLFAHSIIQRIFHLAKAEGLGSVAAFLGARFGESRTVKVMVILIMLAGMLPFLVLQIKGLAICLDSLMGLISGFEQSVDLTVSSQNGLAMIMAIILALICILASFQQPSSHAEPEISKKQSWLMTVLGVESLAKIVILAAIACFILLAVFDNSNSLSFNTFSAASLLGQNSFWLVVLRCIFLAFLASSTMLLLPHVFLIVIRDNPSERVLERAFWLFPLYCVGIALFLVPVLLANLSAANGAGEGNGLALLLAQEKGGVFFALLGFFAAMSAAVMMAIAASLALADMVMETFVPSFVSDWIRRNTHNEEGLPVPALLEKTRVILRAIIIGLFFILAFWVYHLLGPVCALSELGMIALGGIAQCLPAFWGGLISKRINRRGIILGQIAGLGVWILGFVLPLLVKRLDLSLPLLNAILEKSQSALFLVISRDLPILSSAPLLSGLFLSLVFNAIILVLASLSRRPYLSELKKADLFVLQSVHLPLFVRFGRKRIKVGDLEDMVGRYLGKERAAYSMQAHAIQRKMAYERSLDADTQYITFAAHLLANAIGPSSSRLLINLLSQKKAPSLKDALKLLDDASLALQNNRDLLENTLNHVSQAIAVFNLDLRLILWNEPFCELLDLPPELGQMGIPLVSILHYLAERGDLGEGDLDELVESRVERLAIQQVDYRQLFKSSGRTLDIHTNRMQDGSIVITFADISERVKAENALESANETLERRVKERTRELMHLNDALRSAKQDAEEANLSKTRFVAAAGHDIMQPLNAARLYATALVNRLDKEIAASENARSEPAETIDMAHNIDKALEAVEDILVAILDIARLDSGAMKTQISAFPIDELLERLEADFKPLAENKGLELRFVSCGLHVRSDRHLLRRLLQNLISNAIKYTPQGRVLVGCRRHKGAIEIVVRDTGVGVPESQRKKIFVEFQRLDEGARIATGLGLGLSIVDRIAKVLDHPVHLVSTPSKGSAFSVNVPAFRLMHSAKRLETPPAMSNQPLHDLCLLCVDNEPVILDGMRVMLEGWGCLVLTAEGLDQAFEEVEKLGRSPDGLLIDYHLEGMLGTEAAKRLREKLDEKLPVSLVTADRTSELREQVKELGMAILNKPLKPAQLRALLNTWNSAVKRKRQAQKNKT